MHLIQPQAIEKPGHVRGHVADRVRRRPAAHHDVSEARRREVPQVGRFAHIPVVEPDDEMTAPGQAFAEFVRPADHLRRQAHDQHHRRGARVTERLIGQLDAVRGHPAQRARGNVIHGRSLARIAFGRLRAVRRLCPARNFRLQPAPDDRAQITSVSLATSEAVTVW